MTPEASSPVGKTLRAESRPLVASRFEIDRWVPLGLFIFWAAIYSAFPSRSFLSQGIRYAEAVERHDPASIIFSGHVIYGFMGDLAYRAALALGDTGRAYFVLQALSVPFALAGLVLFYSLLKQIGVSTRVAALAALGLGSTYFYWEYAISAEVYSIASFLVILTLYLFAGASRSGSSAGWLLAGITSGLAILIHQLNILLPVVVALAAVNLSRPFAARIRSLAFYGVATVATVAIPYAVIWMGVARRASGMSFVDWALVYLQPQFTGGTRIWSTDLGHIWASAYGVERALFSPFFVSRFVESPISPWALLAVLAALVSLGLGVYVVRGLFSVIKTKQERRSIFALALALVLVYGLFITLWEGATLQYWFAVWIGIWVLVALGWSRSEEQARGARILSVGLTAVVGTLFFTNLAGGMAPESDIRNSEDYQFSRFVMNSVPMGSLIILPGWGGLSNGPLLNYFGQFKLSTFSRDLAYPNDLARGIDLSICSTPGVYLVSDGKVINSVRTFAAQATVKEKIAADQGAWDIFGDRVQSFIRQQGYHLALKAEYTDPANPRYAGNAIWQLTAPGRVECLH